MKATGLFFLRTRPYVARNARGEPALLLPVVERIKDEDSGAWVTLNELTAVWKGEGALQFHAMHASDLVPGRGLELELDRLRTAGTEWRANVVHLQLAPLAPSWAKHNEHISQGAAA